jgi:hypothetical protein
MNQTLIVTASDISKLNFFKFSLKGREQVNKKDIRILCDVCRKKPSSNSFKGAAKSTFTNCGEIFYIKVKGYENICSTIFDISVKLFFTEDKHKKRSKN